MMRSYLCAFLYLVHPITSASIFLGVCQQNTYLPHNCENLLAAEIKYVQCPFYTQSKVAILQNCNFTLLVVDYSVYKTVFCVK